jgi:hypothetical protein
VAREVSLLRQGGDRLVLDVLHDAGRETVEYDVRIGGTDVLGGLRRAITGLPRERMIHGCLRRGAYPVLLDPEAH